MGGKNTESCGRCSMSSVVDVARSDDEPDDRAAVERVAIEVDDETLRRLSPSAWAGRATARLDALVNRFVYGR